MMSFLCLSSLESKKKRRRAGGLVMSKKRRRLLPFVSTEDPTRRLEQMASLATALNATGAEFSNKLTYIPGMAPRSANCSSRERDGMQVLPNAIYLSCLELGLSVEIICCKKYSTRPL